MKVCIYHIVHNQPEPYVNINTIYSDYRHLLFTLYYLVQLKFINLSWLKLLKSIFYKPIFKDFAFLTLRVFTGSLLIHHGFEKLNDINNFADAFVRPLHLPFPVTLSYLAAGSEIGGSWLLIVGLGTRLGATAILGTMSVAIYHAIATSGFNIYLLELLALFFCFCFFNNSVGARNFSLLITFFK